MKILLLCLLLINFRLFSQQPAWHEGSVVLKTNDVLAGKISIEPLYHLILFETDDIRTVYPAHRLQAVYFYDKSSNINRRFVSLGDRDPVRQEYRLYEVVLQGEVTLLRKQKIKARYPSDALDFDYFILYEDEIVSLRKFNRRVYPSLQTHVGRNLEEYVVANHLRTTNDVNAIRIIEFYNRLMKADETIARY